LATVAVDLSKLREAASALNIKGATMKKITSDKNALNRLFIKQCVSSGFPPEPALDSDRGRK